MELRKKAGISAKLPVDDPRKTQLLLTLLLEMTLIHLIALQDLSSLLLVVSYHLRGSLAPYPTQAVAVRSAVWFSPA